MTPLRFEILEECRFCRWLSPTASCVPTPGLSTWVWPTWPYGGSGTNYYLPLFPTAGNPANPVGADLANDALQNYSMNYGGVRTDGLQSGHR